MRSCVKHIAFLFVACGPLLASGCHNARYVQRDNTRGVVAIPANTNGFPKYRDQAAKLMLEHFPDGFIVDKEQEVVIGEKTRHESSDDSDIVQVGNDVVTKSGSSSGSTTTLPETEYRIYYRRK